MTQTTHIGKKINELRKRKKITLKIISQQTGLSISFLSQLEHGKTSATLESLKKISESLGVNPSYFGSLSNVVVEITLHHLFLVSVKLIC